MNTRRAIRWLMPIIFLVFSVGAAYSQPTPACPVGGFPAVSCPIITDGVILTNVSSRMLGTVTTSQTPICVRVADGVVTLSGQVADERRRQLATLLAASVRGVQRVNNMLTIGGITAADTELVSQVKKALSHQPYNISQVKVYANEGVIELRGMVNSGLARDVLGGVAQGVPGVTAVHNNLVVSDIANNNFP